MTRDERTATLRAGCASSAPGAARAFVARTGRAWDLAEPVIEAAQLATSELVSNSVEHALSGVQVTLVLADDQLRIAVRDHSTARPVRRTPSTAGARGRGIALVDAVAQEWGVLPHPDGKTVWLVLPISTDGADDGPTGAAASQPAIPGNEPAGAGTSPPVDTGNGKGPAGAGAPADAVPPAAAKDLASRRHGPFSPRTS
jgi:anti-sigma regulatory factor (Ser/Thr protein kinase)